MFIFPHHYVGHFVVVVVIPSVLVFKLVVTVIGLTVATIALTACY